MADHQEDEDLKLALQMSMQHNPPEPKRSKPIEETGSGSQFGGGSSGESPEAKSRRLQRELMAAAAEKRMVLIPKSPPAQAKPRALASPITVADKDGQVVRIGKELGSGDGDGSSGKELSPEESNQLFTMVFGNEVSKSVLAQWTNQGIRFSPDPETTIGLVQHEGGPCGVLAALQAFVLKYLVYFPDEIGKASPSLGVRTLSKTRYVASDSLSCVPEAAKTRALVRSMCEILFMCGNNNRAVIASFPNYDDSSTNQKDEAMAGPLPIESASDLQKILRFETFTTQSSALNKLEGTITAFQSRMGALLFLISALLSRGLDTVQTDRDDPSLPLVTAPFGHASQEIVNLLLCGEAVPNVFDGRMDLGGGMFLKGISKTVEVGFLTLLESLNYCKVGQNLKCPKWPIWVIGSESHYTVLFALDPSVQEENELELRECQIRRAFDARDQSGGGGFISVEAFHQVVQETNIRLPTEKLNDLCATGFIVWSELWQVILELDRNLGGIKDSSGMMGKKVFDIYHFNGIAKSDINGGGQAMAVEGGTVPMQRPRLTKLNVSVPPKWTPEEFMSCALPSSSEKEPEVNQQPKPVQHAPLVDCIRTRWARATCSWAGDPPSIV
uniref:Deubiquitinating enzyme MINDY-3/4 conserved domain-containing protein n=2 Tax=Noccaea caerulescens TaxID=107243 RepID=A0A1J3DKB8_NOCCA